MSTRHTNGLRQRSAQTPNLLKRSFKERSTRKMQKLFLEERSVVQDFYAARVAPQIEALEHSGQNQQECRALHHYLYRALYKQAEQHELELLQLSSEFNQFRIATCRRLNEMELRHGQELAALKQQLARTVTSALRSSDLEDYH